MSVQDVIFVQKKLKIVLTLTAPTLVLVLLAMKERIRQDLNTKARSSKKDVLYLRKGDLCDDIDECSTNETECDENARCQNTDGSYKCYCEEGFYGTGRFCQSGQCNDAICDMNKKCVSQTTMDCECKAGFLTGKDGECIDIDECSADKSCNNNGKCSNLPGSYSCSCNQGYSGTTCSVCDIGYSLDEDRNCSDVDECLGVNQCSEYASCSNTVGSYQCKCDSGYWGNGRNCTNHSVLALNTNLEHGAPRNIWAIVVDSNGQKTDLPCFKKEEHTEAYQSCSVSWKNQMIVFGGAIEARQISRVDGQRLTRIGHLNFDFRWGARTVISQKYIILCFSVQAENTHHLEHHQCRRTTQLNLEFTKTSPSKYEHTKTATSASKSKLNSSGYE